MAFETSICIFCKLAAGEVPCLKVAETTEALAFLDVAPLADAHVLVVPKRHYARLSEVPEDVVAAVVQLLPRVCGAVEIAAQAQGCNVLLNNGRVAGQTVEHVHFHVIPRREGDGLGYRWPAKKYEPGRAEELQARLRQIIESTS